MLAKRIFLQKTHKQTSKKKKATKNSSCFSHKKQRKQISKYNNQSKQQTNGSYGMKRTEVSSNVDSSQIKLFPCCPCGHAYLKCEDKVE